MSKSIKDKENKNGKTVLLIVDHKQRDFLGTVFIGYHLQQKYGIKVVATHIYESPLKIADVKPDFVLLNYAMDTYTHLINKLRWLNVGIGVFDTEGGPYHSAKSAATLWRNSRNLEKTDLHFIWGERERQLFIAANPKLTHNKALVCGVPRFDIYAPQWRQMSNFDGAFDRLLEEKYAIPPNKKCIVYCTNHMCEGRFASAEEQFDNYVRATGRSVEEVQKIFSEDRIVREENARAIKDLSRALPDETIIVKVHPFEKVKFYEDMYNGLKNIVILQDEVIASVLLRASVVIQRDCLTAVDAAMSGVPALYLKLSPAPSLYQEFSWLASSLVDSTPALIGAVRNTITSDNSHGTAIPESIKGYLFEWFYKVDGHSGERIADCIAAWLLVNAKKKAPRYKWELYRHYCFQIKGIKKKIKALIRFILRMEYGAPFFGPLRGKRQEIYVQPKFRSKCISEGDLEAMISRLAVFKK